MKDDFMADPLGAESGTYLYENSTPLLECFDEIMTGLRQIQDRDQKLKIGFSCGVLNIFPFGKLEEYQRKYGHIQIQWGEAANQEILRRVRHGGMDIGFVVGQMTDSFQHPWEGRILPMTAVSAQSQPRFMS